MTSLPAAPQTSTTLFYAQPYAIDARGFYFSSNIDFQSQMATAKDRFGNPVEEFEFQLIDGHELLAACRFDQANLHWLEEVELLKEWEKPALFYLMDQRGCDLEEALGKVDDVCLYRGRLLEAAETLFDEIHADRIPDDLKGYFDMEAFARDLRLGGDFTEFEYGDQYWTCTNANGQ